MKTISRWLTLSNLLTASRIVITPYIVFEMISRNWHTVFKLFFIAALTDVLDGYLARLFKEPTTVGAWLDPVADKILLTSTFVTLAVVEFPVLGMPWWFVILLIVREVIILGGSALLLYLRPSMSIVPSVWGKLTTFLQIVLILWLFICYFCSWLPHKSYQSALIVLAVFSFFSLVSYIRTGVRIFRNC